MMKTSILAKSGLGKWTLGLAAYYLTVVILGFIFMIQFKIIRSEIIMTIAGASFVFTSILAFITGIIAVIKNKERSVLVFTAILIGIVVLLVLFGDTLDLPDLNLPGI